MKATFIFDTVLVEEDNNFYGMTLNYDFLSHVIYLCLIQWTFLQELSQEIEQR